MAHLRHHHDRYVTLAAILDRALGWLPGVQASIGAVRLGVERWADEEAATRPGARDVLRRALLKTTQTILSPVPAFATSCTVVRSEEHTSELQSLMRISYAVFCLKKKKQHHTSTHN